MKIVCKNADNDNDTKMNRHFHNKKYKITFKSPIIQVSVQEEIKISNKKSFLTLTTDLSFLKKYHNLRKGFPSQRFSRESFPHKRFYPDLTAVDREYKTGSVVFKNIIFIYPNTLAFFTSKQARPLEDVKKCLLCNEAPQLKKFQMKKIKIVNAPYREPHGQYLQVQICRGQTVIQ